MWFGGNRKGTYFLAAARGNTRVTSAQIYQRSTATNGDRKRRSKGGRQSLTRLALRDLLEGTTGVSLELFGKRAQLTDAAGQVHALSEAIPMRCRVKAR